MIFKKNFVKVTNLQILHLPVEWCRSNYWYFPRKSSIFIQLKKNISRDLTNINNLGKYRESHTSIYTYICILNANVHHGHRTIVCDFFTLTQLGCFISVILRVFRLKSTPIFVNKPWDTQWRHQMETFSALLALCAGNSPVPGEFLSQRPVTRSFDVFFDLSLNKQLSIRNRDAGDLKRYCAHCDVNVINR